MMKTVIMVGKDDEIASILHQIQENEKRFLSDVHLHLFEKSEIKIRLQRAIKKIQNRIYSENFLCSNSNLKLKINVNILI